MTTMTSVGSIDPTRPAVNSNPATNSNVAAARVAIGLATVGGALAVLGAWMPWLSFFAGLQVISGLRGPSGWAIAALGLIAVAGGVVGLLRGGTLGRWISGLAGFGVLAVGGWAAVGLLGTASELARDPLIVSALEPGLLVALIGGGLAFAVLFVPALRPAPDTARVAPDVRPPA